MASAQEKKVPSEKTSQVVQKQAIVTLENTGSTSIKLDRSENWSGNPDGNVFPANVSPHGDVKFTHLSGTTYGSVAMVQYSGLSKSGKMIAMIVAWDAPYNYSPPNVPNRVYTYQDIKSTVDGKTLDQILMSLEKSSATANHATIVHHDNGNAVVVGNFNFNDWA